MTASAAPKPKRRGPASPLAACKSSYVRLLGWRVAGTYSEDAIEFLTTVARYIRLFNMLLYASVTKRFAPVSPPRTHFLHAQHPPHGRANAPLSPLSPSPPSRTLRLSKRLRVPHSTVPQLRTPKGLAELVTQGALTSSERDAVRAHRRDSAATQAACAQQRSRTVAARTAPTASRMASQRLSSAARARVP